MEEINGISLEIEELRELCKGNFSHDFNKTIDEFEQENYTCMHMHMLKSVDMFEVGGPEMDQKEIDEWIEDSDNTIEGVPCLVCLLKIMGVLPKDKNVYIVV